jgi:hypothetical protein
MSNPSWPDALQSPQPAQLQQLLTTFWKELALLGDLLPRQQFLLAAEQLHGLRQTVLQMMLALNGIQRPLTNDLNLYLGASQRAALEKTLLLPSVEHKSLADGLIGQAVALVVIYRWYAPQLVNKFGLLYPHEQEMATWQELLANLPTWPEQVTTE